MADFWIVKGDVIPSIMATLEDENHDPIDISAADITFTMAPIRGGDPVITDAPANCDQVGEGDDGTKGQVSYDWIAGDTDVAGGYRGEWRVEFMEGIGTFPNNGYVTIAIKPRLEAAAS